MPFGDKFVKSIKIKSLNQEKELAVQGYLWNWPDSNSGFAKNIEKNDQTK